MFKKSRKKGLEILPENVAVLQPIDEVDPNGHPIITCYVQIDEDSFLDLQSLSQAIEVSHANNEILLLPLKLWTFGSFHSG